MQHCWMQEPTQRPSFEKEFFFFFFSLWQTSRNHKICNSIMLLELKWRNGLYWNTRALPAYENQEQLNEMPEKQEKE